MKIVIGIIVLGLILEIPIIKKWIIAKKDSLDIRYKSNKKWKDEERQ